MKEVYEIKTFQDRGRKSHNEDRVVVIRNFGGELKWIFGGVYDGHNGSAVSDYAAKKLHQEFLRGLNMQLTIAQAFKKAFKIVSRKKEFSETGATALSFLIQGEQLYVANAGDCRMIMVFPEKIDQITSDHRIYNQKEADRIRKKGTIVCDGYIKRGADLVPCFMPTRVIGDNSYRHIGFTDEPEIFVRMIPKQHGIYLIVGTDGLWDEISNEDIAAIVRNSQSFRKQLKKIREKIYALTPPRDNVTMIMLKT